MRDNVVQRREAVRLFREIFECTPNASVFSGVFLLQRSEPARLRMENIELWISAPLDNTGFRNLRSIVKKRKLVLEEKRGFYVIYEADPKETEREIYA